MKRAWLSRSGTAAVVGGLVMLAVVTANANPANVGLGGAPVWCFGANEFDQCVLYLGTKESCQNLAPCLGTIFGLPTPRELTFCLGADDVTGECRLFLGTESQCQSLDPCRAVPGQLPRAPRVAPR